MLVDNILDFALDISFLEFTLTLYETITMPKQRPEIRQKKGRKQVGSTPGLSQYRNTSRKKALSVHPARLTGPAKRELRGLAEPVQTGRKSLDKIDAVGGIAVQTDLRLCLSGFGLCLSRTHFVRISFFTEVNSFPSFAVAVSR